MRPDRFIDIEKLPADPVIPDRMGPLFWHFMKQIRWLILAMIVLNTGVGILNASMPWFVGQIVDGMAAGAEDPMTALPDILPMAGLLVGFSLILFQVFNGLWRYLGVVVFETQFANLIRRQAHWYTLRHSLNYFQSDFAGRIANKVIQIGFIRNVISTAIGALMYVSIFFITTAVLASGADIRLLVPMAVWLLLYLVILRVFIPHVQKHSISLSEAQSQVVGRIVDSYTNIATVKLFARKEYEDSSVIQALKNQSSKYIDKNKQIFTMMMTLIGTNSVMITVILGMSIHFWSQGIVSPGQIAMILPLTINIHHQMQWIMWEVTGLFENLGMVEDSMDTIAVPHRVTDDEDATQIKVTKGDIEFKNMTFHYGKGSGVIEDMNLTIPAGQKVGLVGHSGAGKSTLVSLLLRFYDLEGGSIEIDGQNIAEHTQDSLRSQIAMVTQDTSLLHRSILDNIRYGRPDASMEEVIAAAEKAHAHEFIKDLRDDGGREAYEAQVGERGVKLSGGQRQRIAIARLILKNAPILILDEATSALDSEVEACIQEQLDDLMQGKTVIAIAHRLSTIAKMDRLVVMEEGKITEDGPHDTLVKAGGHYAHLWNLQSGGFLP